jgi:hypothetical protein
MITTDLAGILSGYGLTAYSTYMPDQPDNAVSLRLDSGLPADQAHVGTRLVRPVVQVLIRTNDRGTIETQAGQIHNWLTFYNRTINGNRYVSCTPLHYPYSIGDDLKGRALYIMDLAIVCESIV